MALPNVGGGRQLGDGNANEPILGSQGAPATMTSTAAITAAQLATGLILGSPGGSAASYTLPTVALWEAVAANAHTDSSFDFSIINVDGNGSGVVTLVAGTGWTLSGLVTLAATAGTAGRWRARKTGASAWTAYRLA
jgi:hypothetical protein